MMRIRFTIKTLLILTTLIVVLGAYYSSVGARVTAERRALLQLRDRGIEVIPKSTRIPSQSVREMVDWPWHTLMGKEIPCCRGVHLSLNASPPSEDKRDGLFGDSLKALRSCSCLEWVTFHSSVTPDEIRFLKGLPRLNSVDLMSAGVGESLVDSLMELEHLESVSFGKNQISKASFHRFCNAGILVDHYGIKDHRLDANFLEHDELCYSVDPAKTVLTMRVSRLSTQYDLDLTTRPDRYTQDLEDVKFCCELNGLKGKLDGLVGQSQPMSKPWPSTTDDYYLNLRGSWCDVSEFSYQIAERQGSRFRIKGIFNLKDSTSAKIDAWFQVKVHVYLEPGDGLDELANALKRVGLDLDEFSEPVHEKKHDLFKLIFKETQQANEEKQKGKAKGAGAKNENDKIKTAPKRMLSAQFDS